MSRKRRPYTRRSEIGRVSVPDSKAEVRGENPDLTIGYDPQPRGETYTSVSRHGLQKAFALAHLLSESESVPQAQKRQFKAIANLIWWAHGEPDTPPNGSGAILWETVSNWDDIRTLLEAEKITRTTHPNPADQPDSNKKEKRYPWR